MAKRFHLIRDFPLAFSLVRTLPWVAEVRRSLEADYPRLRLRRIEFNVSLLCCSRYNCFPSKYKRVLTFEWPRGSLSPHPGELLQTVRVHSTQSASKSPFIGRKKVAYSYFFLDPNAGLVAGLVL